MTVNDKMESMCKEATITPWIDFVEELKKTAGNISHDSLPLPNKNICKHNYSNPFKVQWLLYVICALTLRKLCFLHTEFMCDEFEMILEESVIAYSRYYPGIWLEGLRKRT
jgi:hypothetical protein